MTSNEKSFPWDDHNGDREYSSDEFAEFFSTLFKPGVVATANFGTGLQITESASLGMRVKFGSGEAFSSFGRNYVHDKDEEVTVPIASTLQDRTDSVAIQFNKSQREAFFVYKESDTTVTRTDSIFELQIAKILVPKNSTQITNANITDMRANESVCGYFSPHGELNTGDITAQFVAWFNDFKGKLGTDPATNLQLQITDLDSKVVHNTGDETISGVKNFKDGIKIKDLDVFPSYKIGSWFVENLDGNMYRLTTTISVDRGIDQPWGSLYLSVEIQHPDLPAGFTKTGFTVSVSKTNNLMWSSVSGPSTFRLISGTSTAGGTGREVIIQVMATK